MKRKIEPKLLRPCEVMHLLSISESTLSRMRKEGEICAVSLNGITRYPASEIDRLIGNTEDGNSNISQSKTLNFYSNKSNKI